MNEILVANLFLWARSTPPDWALGALYAGLGLMGALVTLFGLVGGAVPGTAGKVRLDTDYERLDRITQELEKLLMDRDSDPIRIKEVGDQVDKIRDDLRRDKWIQFTIASVFYAILGAFFAMMLAQDILQAIIMGAGWTSFIGTLGLKKDFKERKDIKDRIIDTLFDGIPRREGQPVERSKAEPRPFLEDITSVEEVMRARSL